MDHVTGPAPTDGAHPIRLSAVEFAALLPRLNPSVPMDGPEYVFTDAYPVRFWVPRQEWETHNLRHILHNCAVKWKDVLTEPTLQKLRALLADEGA